MKFIVILPIIIFLSSCSQDDTEDKIAKNVANAENIFEMNKEVEVEGLGIRFYRARLWRTRANDSAAGVGTIIDKYSLELWYKLEGDLGYTIGSTVDAALEGEEEEETDSEEDKNKHRYAVITLMNADDSGNLYFQGSEPGTVFYDTSQGNTVTSDGIFNYTVETPDSLISTKYPAYASYSETTSGSGGSTTKTSIIKASDQKDAGWENVHNYTMGSSTLAFASRTRYEENKDFGTKGKMGCVVTPAGSSGDLLGKTFAYGDVELGSTIQNKENKQASTDSGAQTSLGDDDTLWIKWTEAWYLTGFNYKDRKLRLFRGRTAPFYAARELPGVDTSDTTPKLSGIDALVRNCNTAAKNSGGSFRLMYVSNSTPRTASITLGTAASYCSSLANASSVNSIDTTSYSGCSSFSGVSALVDPGTWNGSSHSGPITDASSSLVHGEQSEIKEIEL